MAFLLINQLVSHGYELIIKQSILKFIFTNRTTSQSSIYAEIFPGKGPIKGILREVVPGEGRYLCCEALILVWLNIAVSWHHYSVKLGLDKDGMISIDQTVDSFHKDYFFRRHFRQPVLLCLLKASLLHHYAASPFSTEGSIWEQRVIVKGKVI